MNLLDIAYQIDGILESKFNPDYTCKVTLLDNIHEPAVVVRPAGQGGEVEASATGATRTEAESNLVELLRGNILKHEWPVMWTCTTVLLRIPPTLTAR